MIQILDKTFVEYISRESIETQVSRVAQEINSDLAGEDVVFLAVLNGSFMFASDLMKKIKLDSEISFVKVQSYEGTNSTGEVSELIGLSGTLENKTVVVIEDIVDTGNTVKKINSILENSKVKSVKLCTLLFKPDAFKGDRKPDYIGFSIPNAFVVGYGLDYDQKGRNLDRIYQIKDN